MVVTGLRRATSICFQIQNECASAEKEMLKFDELTKMSDVKQWQSLKLQSAYIDKGIEKIIKNLDNVAVNLNVTRPDSIKKFNEETEILQTSLDDLIKILTRGTEEQKKTLEECEAVLKEVTEYSSKFIEKSPINNEISNDGNGNDGAEYDIDDDCEVQDAKEVSVSSDGVADLILSSYQLLNKSLPKLL
ncbi:hypothetical protein FQR65_LT03812 [Abscondita terminalis]|nr:hypothetical protein FQR65_LT03812 [Abscondita terminalis]